MNMLLALVLPGPIKNIVQLVESIGFMYGGWSGAMRLKQWLANSGMEAIDHVQLPCVLHCSLGAFAGSLVRLECVTTLHLW